MAGLKEVGVDRPVNPELAPNDDCEEEEEEGSRGIRLIVRLILT